MWIFFICECDLCKCTKSLVIATSVTLACWHLSEGLWEWQMLIIMWQSQWCDWIFQASVLLSCNIFSSVTSLWCFFITVKMLLYTGTDIHVRILLIDQLDTQICSIIFLFQSSTCFKQLCAHHQEDNCINLLKPTGSMMRQQVLTFNNCTFCPHCIYVFCIYLRTNSDLCHLQHKLIGFYNRDEKCLLRGTNWVFK